MDPSIPASIRHRALRCKKFLRNRPALVNPRIKEQAPQEQGIHTLPRLFLLMNVGIVSTLSDIPSEVQSEVESLCVRGERRVGRTMPALLSLFEIIIIVEDGRQRPECKNTCFCLSLWSMFCMWLWIIGDSIPASCLARGAYVCLYINNTVNPQIIIPPTFSPFLCNLMDHFAADVQVKIKKQVCL